MNTLHIGSFVYFSHDVRMGYPVEDKRRIIRTPAFHDAACGFVCGARRFYEGDVNHVLEHDDYSLRPYSITEFITKRVVYVWVVRQEFLGPDIFVLPDDIVSVLNDPPCTIGTRGLPEHVRRLVQTKGN